MTKPVPKVFLKIPSRSVRPGHPWFYRSQASAVALEPGEIVDVFGADKAFVGRGYYNPRSEIPVRLLARHAVAIDASWVTESLRRAAAYRERHVSDTDAYRLVASEADGMPGLVVDRYGPVLVVQFLTAGMERLRGPVIEGLRRQFEPKGIFERSDAPSRKIEGLEPRAGWIEQHCGEAVEVREGCVRFAVRFAEGHKTGMYLDQRENRLALAAADVHGDVLDAFCYEGGFALHQVAAGRRVLAIDSQKDALERAEANRRLNGIEDGVVEFRNANVFDELKAMSRQPRRFGLVVLDPPSFVRRKEAVEGALTGYKEILLRGMRLTADGGLLAVFSCSYHVDDNLLMQVSMAAARDARKSLRVVRFLKQAADHPVDPFIPETYYLKGFLFAVLD